METAPEVLAADEPLHKYDTRELTDPLLRCDNCAKLVHRAFIEQNFLYSVNGEELEALKDGSYDLGMEYTIDPEFLAIFVAVKE
ncbi:MAG: hypothetical protein ACYSTZ_09010 [Planctomycetota bacterium]|jgi:hypothetical protein